MNNAQTPKLTPRQKDAIKALGDAVKTDGDWQGVTPARFAMFFWPDKRFARINGPYGLGPDSSGMHAGRMLRTLRKLGLAQFHDHTYYYTAALTRRGQDIHDQLTRTT